MSDPGDPHSDPSPPPGSGPPEASALDVLVRPRRFFEALAARPPRLMPPFAVVAATVLLNATGGALLLVSGEGGPQGARALELMGEVDTSSAAFVLGVALAAGLGSLVSWAIAWLPLRLAVGAGHRLWELAGFAHAPYLAAAPLQLGLASLLGGQAGAAGFGISLAATAASCFVVWGGLQALAPAAAARGTAAYVAFQVISVGLGFVLGASSGGGGGGTLVM